ncbi:unnamed protein product [Cuscuta epithymum]|uniref:Uncharacterized protein n=1 Tax=Cuscuta epithymum TaxID=186058 RepID=A0AAV0F6N7_9ASTE|nr:unnamed protein product [Cuscuta epithymum]CAH9131135.1 unnamed protein product [Cuscuta epithymum]
MEDTVSLLVSSPSTWISKRRSMEETNQDDIIVDVQNLFISNSMKMDGKNYDGGGGCNGVSGSPFVNRIIPSGRCCRVTKYPLPDLMEAKNIALYERIVALSKMSLSFYEKNHPGESYEFDSLKHVKSAPILGITYFITFLAKKLGADGSPSGMFKARVNEPRSSVNVQKCELTN